MAAGTTSPETSQVIAYDRYIETQLHRTRRQVKGVDLSTSLMLLVVASLVYLMLVALLDHWVVKGGLSVAARMVAFGVLAAGVAVFAVFRLFPLAMRRVNPVYAAYTIERHRPGLKNSLINFLMLRSGSDRLPERIYQAMEAQAASALSSAHAEVAVDRTPLIRLLLALVAAVFLVAMYAVLSPKNPFTSFRRVISPWSDVAPPTRVLIRDIQPGDANGFHDQHVAVSAQIDGVRTGEPVVLRYSTVDGQVMARAVPMAKPENAYRYAAELPPDNLGLQQDLEYWIEAGDAFSPHHKIKVDTAPTIVVEELEYQYPSYAELPPRTVARHGDIQALAGTRVTLRARANQPIHQANLDFECDGRNDLDMHVDGTRATVSFPLVWSDSLRRPEHESYQLRFRNQDGHENPKPIRYTIEVIRDLPPEIELVEPELDPSKDLVVPAGRPVRFAVQAADPDFKLAAVKFQARRGKTPLVEESLLAEPRGGQFHRDYLLDLKRLEVKPGEQIEFWASADDNRQPGANHSETPRYRLRVASADEQGQGQDDRNARQNPDQNGQSKPDDGQKKQSGQRNNENREGDEGGEDGEQKSDDKNKSGGKSKNGKKNERQKEQGNESGEQESSEGGESSQGKRDGQRRPSDKPQAGDSSQEKSGEEKSDSGGDQERGGQGGKKGADKSEESKRVDPDRDAGKAIDEINKYFNEKNNDNKSDNRPEKKQQDGKQPEDQQSGDQQSGENKTGQSDGKAGKEAREPKEGSQSQGDEPQQGEGTGKQSKPGGEMKEKQPSPEQGEKGDGKNGDQQTGAGQKEPGKQPGKNPESGGSDSQEQRKDGEQRKGTKEQGGRSKGGDKGEQAQQTDKQQGDKPQDKNQSEGGQQGDKKKQGENGPLADQQNDQKGGPGDQAGAKDQGDEKQGEKPGAKNGKKGSAGEKAQSGDKQGVPNEGGDKSEKDKTGDGKQGDAQTGDEQAKHADGETHPRDGQGGEAKGAGEPDDKVKKHKGESPDQKGTDPDSKDKGEGGAGDSEGANKHGAPTTHGGNQGREKKQLSPDPKKGTSEDEAESSSESKRQSDSQGGQQGERDGGGKSGGGQRSNSEGTGAAGQNSEADQGGGQGETRGKGATGEKGGDQQKADKPTGGKASGEKGPGSNQGQGQESDKGRKAESPETADPRGHKDASNSSEPNRESGKNAEKQPPGKRPQAPQNKENKKQPDGAPQPSANNEGVDGQPTPSDRGGHDVRGGQQRSNPTAGGEPGPAETTPPPATDDSEPGGEDPNQEYARKATDLALERLKDQLAKDKPDPELLNKLKWSPEDMERFVQQWDRLKKAADEAGPKGDAARQELDDALRSLGLRPRGSTLSGGQKRDDKVRNLREGRRAPPPPEYQEQYIEFNKARAKGTK